MKNLAHIAEQYKILGAATTFGRSFRSFGPVGSSDPEARYGRAQSNPTSGVCGESRSSHIRRRSTATRLVVSGDNKGGSPNTHAIHGALGKERQGYLLIVPHGRGPMRPHAQRAGRPLPRPVEVGIRAHHPEARFTKHAESGTTTTVGGSWRYVWIEAK